MASVFPTVLRDPAEQTNTLMLGSEAPASAERLDAAAKRMGDADLADLARFDAARLAPPLPGGEVYTDDRAPVEWLIDRTILGYAADELNRAEMARVRVMHRFAPPRRSFVRRPAASSAPSATSRRRGRRRTRSRGRPGR